MQPGYGISVECIERKNHMDIGEVLSKAWNIIWKHKVLWIFGILAGCVNGGGSNNVTIRQDLPQKYQNYVNSIPKEQIVLIIIVAAVVIFILVALAIFLGTIGRVGVIRGTIQADQGVDKLTFGELFSGSTRFFWRVFLLNLVVGIAIAITIILILIFYGVATVATLGIGGLCLLPFLCLLVPFLWLIQIVIEAGSLAVVIEDLGILEGLRRGWEVVTKNLGTIILMWLVLGLGVTLIGGFIIGIPLLVVAGPALYGVISGNDPTLTGGIIASIVCFAAYLPVLLVLNGILRSYIESAWTLTYLRLTGRPVIAETPAEPVLEPA
jgi:hypothetical protein